MRIIDKVAAKTKEINAVDKALTANPNPVRLTGNSLLVNSHRENPVFITRNPCSHCRDLFSLQRFPCKPLYFPVGDYSVDSKNVSEVPPLSLLRNENKRKFLLTFFEST